jgi:glucokinase
VPGRAVTSGSPPSAAPLGLVGDVGGTNARFGVADASGILRTQTWPTAGLPSLREIADALGLHAPLPAFACVAVAAPVSGPAVTLTNAHTTVDVRTLGTPGARLANDLEAAAAGIVDVPAADRTRLVEGAEDSSRPTVVVGLGTGLGVAIRLPDGSLVAGEGGHAPFATTHPVSSALSLELARALGRPVEWEDLLCGRGFGRLVAYTRGNRPLACSTDFAQLEALAHTTAGEEDSEAHRLFAEATADLLRGLALTVRAGAVYLCGGVAGHLLHALRTPAFQERFRSPGPVSHVLDHVPVTVLTDDALALRGCIRLSRA